MLFRSGLPIALAGAVFRGLAAGVIHKDAQLARQGVYGWTRNPLYLGSSLLALGFAVMSFSAISAVLLLVPSVLIYPNVISREEEHLEQLFPDDFPRYRTEVPRFFPRFQSSPLSFSYEQYLKNREYNTALGLIAALTIFVLKLAH